MSKFVSPWKSVKSPLTDSHGPHHESPLVRGCVYTHGLNGLGGVVPQVQEREEDNTSRINGLCHPSHQ
jgi:hypothetical protein